MIPVFRMVNSGWQSHFFCYSLEIGWIFLKLRLTVVYIGNKQLSVKHWLYSYFAKTLTKGWMFETSAVSYLAVVCQCDALELQDDSLDFKIWPQPFFIFFLFFSYCFASSFNSSICSIQDVKERLPRETPTPHSIRNCFFHMYHEE